VPGDDGRGIAVREVTAAAAIAAGLCHRGSLEADGALRLCYLAAAAQAGGRLQIASEQGQFTLCFKRGIIEHASSDAPEDDLGRFLVAKGVVSAEAVADAERVRADLGGDLVAALVQLRVMNPADSFRSLQEHGIGVAVRALGSQRGEWAWDPGASPPSTSFPLGARWGILCDAVRRLGGQAVRSLLGERAHRVATRAGGRVELGDLKLTAQEVRAVAHFDARSSPEMLAAAFPSEAEAIFRVALLLGETELLSFGPLAQARAIPDPTPGDLSPPPTTPKPPPPGPRAKAPAQAPKVPAKPVPPKSAPPPARPAADVAGLKALYERIKAGDHFQALGVKRESTASQIKAAYFQLAKTYHPDAGPMDEPPEVKKLRADIFGRLGEAWGVLGEDNRRGEYLRELTTGGVKEIDVSAIFKAEEAFRRATVFVKTRQYEKALETLAEAISLNPDESEFGIWKAWVEFLLAPDRKRQQATSAKVIEGQLRKTPRCIPGYHFLGQMAKLLGDLKAAEEHFKRGLAQEPENADLAREMKYLRK